MSLFWVMVKGLILLASFYGCYKAGRADERYDRFYRKGVYARKTKLYEAYRREPLRKKTGRW